MCSVAEASPPPVASPATSLHAELREIIPRETTNLAWVSVAFAAVLGSIYPFIRKVDDLFNISTELAIVMVTVAVLASKTHTKKGQVIHDVFVSKRQPFVGGCFSFSFCSAVLKMKRRIT